MTAELPKGLQQIGHGPSFKERLSDMLEDITMFNDFTRRELETLADYMQAYDAVPGTMVFREGHRDSFLCLVVEGKLDVIKEADGGKQRKLATIRPGKTIGEMSIIDQQPHSATVVAKTETVLLLFTQGNFERIAEEHTRLAFKVLWKMAQTLSHRLRQTSGLLVDHL